MSETQHTPAAFIAKTDARGREIPERRRQPIPVHFNPESLEITCTNTLQKGNRNQPAQVVSEATAKLSMELIFDTTPNGSDVRGETHRIARLMDPAQQSPRRRDAEAVKVPAIVIFKWGTILFEGYIDTYKERVEFFSPEGVPLRAVVTLSLTQQQRSFSPAQTSGSGQGGAQNPDLAPSQNEPVRRLGGNQNMTDTARNLGDANAAKQLAAVNGIENLRHPEVSEIVVSRRGAANGLLPSAQAAAGFDLSAQASAGAGLSLSGTQALFAGLKTRAAATANLTSRVKLDLDINDTATGALSLKGGGGFGIGGETGADAEGGLTADVGLDADIELGIRFEE